MNPSRRLITCSYCTLALLVPALGAPADRKVPAPDPGHPGNVFLLGEEVSIAGPGGTAAWTARDDAGRVVARGNLQPRATRAVLGKLPVGWYRIEFAARGGKTASATTAAVLSPLRAPAPLDSPICCDAAAAWFSRNYPDVEASQAAFAGLAALAGINWIRDRLSWGGVETAPGLLAPRTVYDSSAAIQASHELQVLQVFHSTPQWAQDRQLDGSQARSRFPRDLRAAFSFCKAAAARFRGKVLAWEPWNEANIPAFGGHTIDEMCALQKASYLGFKAGCPDGIVCWNVFAGAGTKLHTEGVLANETWPYFETFNIHSYQKPEAYLGQFAPAREAACGRPLWFTECGIRLKAESPAPWGDLSPASESRQARFVARSYAQSLYAGVDRHFFFILGNYIERGVQFGLLRHDQTPRPGYVALAAVGRFLAGARCTGKASDSAYAFRSRPDGRDRDVLVAWGKETPWSGLRVEAAYDYLGRKLSDAAARSTRDDEARFIVLPGGELEKLPLQQPPGRSALREGAASPIVLQAEFPANATRLGLQAHEVASGRPGNLAVYVYNLGKAPVSGKVRVTDAPRGWSVQPESWQVDLAPLERKRITATLTVTAGGGSPPPAPITLRGEFSKAGRPVLSARVVASK